MEIPYFGGEEVELDESALEQIGRLWASSTVMEPLARQILLEAITLQSDNPRAALILAVTAAEVGIKQFAADASASAAEGWLVTNMPSPSLAKLVRHYLEFFTDKKTKDGRAVPRQLSKSLTDAVELRNEIVHRGVSPPREGGLAAVFVAVNDLLYLLDWFSGHEWAFDYLQDDTRAAYVPAE
jgi:hypothetical protein